MSRVVVVTNVNLGWDCVVGVYTDINNAVHVIGVEMDDMKTRGELEDIGYCFFEHTVEDGEGY